MRLSSRLTLVIATFEVLALAWTARGAITYTDLYTLGKPDPTAYSLISPQRAQSGAGQFVGTGRRTDGSSVGILWTPQNPNGTPFETAGVTTTGLSATDGTRQVGSVDTRAAVWAGSSTTFSELHPAGATRSFAVALDGNQYGGNATFNGVSHAYWWTAATPEAGIGLSPGSAYASSGVVAIRGGQQAGLARLASSQRLNAMVWNGTAASVVNLNGSLTESQAYGTDGHRQVGSGVLNGSQTSHALMWAGTAGSVTDLHPAGYQISVASGIDGERQIGFARRTNAPAGVGSHAIFWTGSADSAINLGELLGSEFTESFPTAIIGDTVYGFARDTAGQIHAIAWAVPEPAVCGVAVIGLVVLRRRRRINRPAFESTPATAD